MAWARSETNGYAYSESQGLTRSAPSAAADGVPVADLTFGEVYIECSGNVTGGAMQGYVWERALNGGAGAWVRDPNLDWTPATGAARAKSPLFQVVPRGLIMWATAGITLSAGSTVTTWMVFHSPRSAAPLGV